MAYVSTETTRRVRGELKQRLPNLKFSVSKNDGTLRVRIMAGDLDFRDIWEDIPDNKQYWKRYGNPKPHFDGYVSINTYHPDDYNPKYTDLFKQIISIMKGTEWFDNSDPQIDYFSTAYYLKLSVGKWNKPYQYTGTPRMDDIFRRFRGEAFEAPKPQLTKNQMELLNHIKVSAFHGGGKDAYVKTDRKGWDGFKPQLVQKLLDKGIITIPKHYGRIESLKAYTVMLNPIAWEYPFKYDWDKSLKQKGNKIVRNKRIHREETARKLEEQRRRDNMTFDEVYAELFGAEEFEAQLSEYLYKCDACGHITDVRFSDVYSDKYCREACARGRPEKCRGSCGKNGWDVDFTGVYHAGLSQRPSIDTKYGVNIICKDCGIGFYGDARWELYDELPDKSQAEDFEAEFKGREGVWLYRYPLSYRPNDQAITVFKDKEDWLPIWEKLCEDYIQMRNRESLEVFERQMQEKREDFPHLSDEELEEQFPTSFAYWKRETIQIPQAIDDMVVRLNQQGDERGLYSIDFGDKRYNPSGNHINNAHTITYRDYHAFVFYPFGDDEIMEAEEYDEEHEERYKRHKKRMNKLMGFDAEGEDITLKDSAKLGFGLGAGLLGFRVALFGASALVGGLLLNRKE